MSLKIGLASRQVTLATFASIHVLSLGNARCDKLDLTIIYFMSPRAQSRG